MPSLKWADKAHHSKPKLNVKITEQALYEPLNPSSSFPSSPTTTTSPLPPSYRRAKHIAILPLLLTFLATATVFSAVGFLAGNHFSSPLSRGGRHAEAVAGDREVVQKGDAAVMAERPPFLEPPGDVTYDMQYNITYSSEGKESDEAWDAMFPHGKGFISHPLLSPSPSLSGIAVFHQLHCVNILRVGFYAALSGTLPQLINTTQDHNKRPDDHHLRHCFDYLRQSLVCLADSNLEPVNRTLGGVTGWMGGRKCRDFEGLRGWADRWEDWDRALDGMGEGEGHGHGHGHGR